MIERLLQSPKYEHLYRHEIADGPDLAEHVDGYTSTTKSAHTRRWTSSCRSTDASSPADHAGARGAGGPVLMNDRLRRAPLPPASETLPTRQPVAFLDAGQLADAARRHVTAPAGPRSLGIGSTIGLMIDTSLDPAGSVR